MSRFNRFIRFPATVREGLSREKAFNLHQGSTVGSSPYYFKRLFRRPIDGEFNIFVGDWVHILEGRDKGRVGVVRDIFWQKRWIYVTGRNTVLRKERAEGEDVYFHKEEPLEWHQVALIDHSDKKPCITELKYLEDGSVARVSTRTGSIVPMPPEVKEAPGLIGYKDTDHKVAAERTYVVSSKTFAENVLFSPDLKETIFPRVIEGKDPIYAALKFRREREEKVRKAKKSK